MGSEFMWYKTNKNNAHFFDWKKNTCTQVVVGADLDNDKHKNHGQVQWDNETGTI